jgi:biopolymer transport protein TolR
MRKNSGLGGPKKDLNADLNLTPFIDLLSTCVCFLLVTAVWIEIGSVEIKQSHGTEAAASKKISYDLDVVYQGSNKLRMNLKKNGKTVGRFNVKGENFEAMSAQMNTIVQTKVLNFKNKAIEIATATITPRSDVDYGSLVKTLDVLRKNQIVNIGVLSARSKQ